MTLLSKPRLVAQAASWLKRYCVDRKGAAAVEFAFIVPLLLAMYFVTLEAGQAIDTNKKVGRIASMVGDLATQQDKTTASELDAMMRIGAAVIQPYNRSRPDIIITGIQLSNATPPVAKPVWRRQYVNGQFGGSVKTTDVTTVPPTLAIKNTFLVRVEATLAYKPVIVWAADKKDVLGFSSPFNVISMGETYYLRSRMSSTVTCTGCVTAN